MRATSHEVALFYYCIYGLACDALMAIGLLDYLGSFEKWAQNCVIGQLRQSGRCDLQM